MAAKRKELQIFKSGEVFMNLGGVGFGFKLFFVTRRWKSSCHMAFLNRDTKTRIKLNKYMYI